MENNQELSIEYAKWGFIILSTIGLFKFFSKRTSKSINLFLICILPTWFVYSILTGFQYIHFKHLYMLYSFKGFILLLIESLPSSLLVAGITFWKLNSDRKKKESVEQ